MLVRVLVSMTPLMIEIIGLYLGDQVVFPEQWVELDDLL
jgi:hypothetical protein